VQCWKSCSMTTRFNLTGNHKFSTYSLHKDNHIVFNATLPWALICTIKRSIILTAKAWHICYTWNSIFLHSRYGGDLMEKFWIKVYGYNKSLLVCFILFSFLWPLESCYIVTNMHIVHNSTHLLMNKVTHS
jgi:hypothetical protein